MATAGRAVGDRAPVAPLRWLGGVRGRLAASPAAARHERPAPAAVAQARAPLDPADFSPPLRTRLLILQPTPFCNIRCDYCYLPQRDRKDRMTPATAALAAERLRDDGLLGEELTVVWHAGEPLAVPPAFYEEAIARIAAVLPATCRVRHSIQTNATLIDERWCNLIRSRGIEVGVSVDGPAVLHDAHRRTRRGHGTHARVMQGLRRLREHGIAFHAIAVVTADTLARLDEFVEFFAALGVTELGCNFDEAEGGHRRSSLEGQEPAHARFQAALFAHPEVRAGRLRVREFGQALSLVSRPLPQPAWRGTAAPLNTQTLPLAIVNVACNGDFSTFSPELLGQGDARFGSFVLGNVSDGGYLESARREPFVSLWAAVREGVQHCRDRCAHFAYCGGGSPANKLYENGTLASGETLYCRTMLKRPFELALRTLEDEAAARGFVQQGGAGFARGAGQGARR